MTLYDPTRHETLSASRWNADLVEEAIADVVGRTLAAFDRYGAWPSHPNDLGDRAPVPASGLYFGTAGVIWAVARFGVRLVDDTAVLRKAARDAAESIASYGPDYARGLLIGPAGVLAVASLVAGDETAREALYEIAYANASNPVRDFMWGAAGTMLAAAAHFDATGDERWRRVFVLSARQLESELVVSPTTRAWAWSQQLYGHTGIHIGAGHGFAGNVAPVLAAQPLLDATEHERWREVARATTKATAIVEGELANWPQSTDGGRPGRHALLVQWCHGAPGVISALGRLLDGTDPEFDALLLAGGELVWHAGPLNKGAGLCHGTAGNGFAFLRLFAQTKDERWLERARAFAMHAAGQCRAAAEAHGDLRHSLWTGDIGTALFLRACTMLDPRFPTFEYL